MPRPKNPKSPSPRTPRRKTTSLRAKLSQRLRTAKRVAVLAVGSELRADDAAGLLVAVHLRKALRGSGSKVRILLGETAPENFTGQIRDYQPTHLVIIDSAEMGGTPGRIALLDVDRISDTAGFCTHSLPLTLMVHYLRGSFPFETIILAIQPRSIEFGKPVSLPIARAAKSLAADIAKAVAPHR